MYVYVVYVHVRGSVEVVYVCAKELLSFVFFIVIDLCRRKRHYIGTTITADSYFLFLIVVLLPIPALPFPNNTSIPSSPQPFRID